MDSLYDNVITFPQFCLVIQDESPMLCIPKWLEAPSFVLFTIIARYYHDKFITMIP